MPDPATSGASLSRDLRSMRELHEEVAAVIAHFRERPVITAEDATEEDARWIMRYDAVKAKLAKAGL